ncbi:tyrosine-type recombinase/integrase [Actinomadura nitritigenes]|uniref:tyrosine-type recombinase/integrase n=1 Tax=Actinomadura nitritigenes TaxID=134602 RepID=UPI003D94E68C
MTVSDLLDRRLKRRADECAAGQGLAASTISTDHEIITLYLKPGIGHIKVVDLREDDILDLYADIRLINTSDQPTKPSETMRRLIAARSTHNSRLYSTRPVSEARLRRIHAVLTGALNEAVKHLKIIDDSPAANVLSARRKSHQAKAKPLLWTAERVEYWLKTGKTPGKVMVWTPEQTGAFLDFALDERLYAMLHLAAYYGPRRGELVGLGRHEVSLPQRRFYIRESQPDEELDSVKSESSDRFVIFDDETARVLTEWFAQQDAERESWGESYAESGRAFTYEDGRELRPDYVTQRFNEVLKLYNAIRSRHHEEGWDVDKIARRHRTTPERVQAAINGPVLPPVRFHDLRHGAATMAHAAGVSMKVVSEILGHSDEAFTANVYAVVSEELAEQAATSISGFLQRHRRRGTSGPGPAPEHSADVRLCTSCAAQLGA